MSIKILLIGPGSIGKRHLRNLLQLGYRDISVVSRSGRLPADYSSCRIYNSTKDALASGKFDTAFICTPTALHTQDLLLLLEHHIQDIYVEKPLSNSITSINDVLDFANAYPVNIKVGYDLRFDPALQKVKELLQQNAIGEIISANAFVGQHLAQWRPNEDHRKGMSAKVDTGGGVMLDLIHEIDYLSWLLGDVNTVAAMHTNTGGLEIETEEAAEILLRFTNGAMATIHMDYWQPNLKRFCIFTGTKGCMEWNLAERYVTVTCSGQQSQYFSYSSAERNDRFIAIIQSFLQQPDDERLTTLGDAVKSLKVILAAKQSAENNLFIKPGKSLTRFNISDYLSALISQHHFSYVYFRNNMLPWRFKRGNV